MAILEQLYTDLRTVIAATWTDTPADGIWESEHQSMVPWSDLTPPVAAICVGDTPLAADWGVANQTYTPTVSIYYVGIVTGDSDGIRGKLEALRDALLANTVPSTLTILDVPGMAWGPELEPNGVLMAKNYTHRAGRLQVSALIGTRPG